MKVQAVRTAVLILRRWSAAPAPSAPGLHWAYGLNEPLINILEDALDQGHWSAAVDDIAEYIVETA